MEQIDMSGIKRWQDLGKGDYWSRLNKKGPRSEWHLRWGGRVQPWLQPSHIDKPGPKFRPSGRKGPQINSQHFLGQIDIVAQVTKQQ